MPLIKIKGTKTATRTTVVATIAKETCFAPLYAATKGVSPNSIPVSYTHLTLTTTP